MSQTERLIAEAMAAIRDRQWPKAEALLRRLARGKDVPPQVPYNLALVLRELGKPRQVGHWLGEAVRLKPDYAAAWFELGRCRLDEAGDMAGARDAFAEAARHDPTDADAWRNLARISARLGDHAAARDAWRQALAIRDDIEDRVGLVQALLELRDPDADALLKVLWTQPASRAYLLKALTHSSAGTLTL